MPPQSLNTDTAAQEDSQAKQGNQDAERWLWDARGREGQGTHLLALQLAPQSAAIFNSKVCRLQEVRDTARCTSE